MLRPHPGVNFLASPMPQQGQFSPRINILTHFPLALLSDECRSSILRADRAEKIDDSMCNLSSNHPKRNKNSYVFIDALNAFLIVSSILLTFLSDVRRFSIFSSTKMLNNRILSIYIIEKFAL